MPCARAFELQEPSSEVFTESSLPRLLSRLDALSSSVRSSLKKQGFEDKRIVLQRYLNMRWDGTDTALMALGSSPRGTDINDKPDEDFENAFKKAYKQEFGFLLEGKRIIVDDIKVSVMS